MDGNLESPGGIARATPPFIGGRALVGYRGGVGRGLGGSDDQHRALLDEALRSLALVASRLREGQQRQADVEREVERLEGTLGLLEERIDEVVGAIHALHALLGRGA